MKAHLLRFIGQILPICLLNSALWGQEHQVYRYNFPTAVVGAGSDTEIVFANAVGNAGPVSEMTFLGTSTTPTQTAIVVFFLSDTGDLEGTAVTEIVDKGTLVKKLSGFVLDVVDQFRKGHLVVEADGPIVVTERLKLNISEGLDNISQAARKVPPIGVGPAPSCTNPVTALERNEEFDTGVALSNTNAEPVTCNWSIYSGKQGAHLTTGVTNIPGFGQTQYFPLNDPALSPVLLPFLGNIQYKCNAEVHPFSLFQRRNDGALFSNTAACP